MRIVRAAVAAVAAEFPRPLRFRERPMTVNTAVVALLEEAGGAVGLGYAPTFDFGTAALRTHVADDFVPRLVGAEMSGAADGASDLLRDAWIAGRPAGLTRQAVALLEMALYDLEGKLAGLPLHRLWGQATRPVRAYASGGWRHLPIAELAALARTWVDQGFEAVKIQVGLSPAEDAQRLAAVREAVGLDVEVMVDANQRIPVDAAIEWSAALAPYRPAWLEEPIPADSHDELAALRESTSIPIAAGESETELSELQDLLKRDAVDVIQPDLHRAGLTACRTIGAEAEAAGTTLAPHIAHEVSAHLLSGAHDAGWLEYFDWFEDWWETPVVPDRGRVTPAITPGHGLQLRPGWLETHAI
jgi:L-alanine-DL-glutamate epimerase-like enolase superfamily enzyme